MMFREIFGEECIFMEPLQTTVPIYVSEKSVKNLWQDYRVYADRVELRSWAVLSTFVIRAEDIVDVKVSTGLFTWGLKLDLADLFEHVELRRKRGLFRSLKFTPDNPERFVEACQSIMRPT
jgi:hypothetical protein